MGETHCIGNWHIASFKCLLVSICTWCSGSICDQFSVHFYLVIQSVLIQAGTDAYVGFGKSIFNVCLFVYSYLPSIAAASFCRGFSTIHTAAAGRPFRWAEVWKCCPWCFRTGAECRDGGVSTKLRGNSGGRPVPGLTGWRKSLITAAFAVLWQLTWFTRCPVCTQTWKHRDRSIGRKRKRLRFKVLTQRNAILLPPALFYFTLCEEVAARHTFIVKPAWNPAFSCKIIFVVRVVYFLTLYYKSYAWSTVVSCQCQCYHKC